MVCVQLTTLIYKFILNIGYGGCGGGGENCQGVDGGGGVLVMQLTTFSVEVLAIKGNNVPIMLHLQLGSQGINIKFYNYYN